MTSSLELFGSNNLKKYRQLKPLNRESDERENVLETLYLINSTIPRSDNRENSLIGSCPVYPVSTVLQIILTGVVYCYEIYTRLYNWLIH